MVTASGDLLLQTRLRAGLSQRELARRSGTASTLISAYENGRRVPSADAMLRLLRSAGAVIQVGSTVERGRRAAAELEQVVAIGMALPRREAGPLRYPSFRSFTTG